MMETQGKNSRARVRCALTWHEASVRQKTRLPLPVSLSLNPRAAHVCDMTRCERKKNAVTNQQESRGEDEEEEEEIGGLAFVTDDRVRPRAGSPRPYVKFHEASVTTRVRVMLTVDRKTTETKGRQRGDLPSKKTRLDALGTTTAKNFFFVCLLLGKRVKNKK